MENHTVTAGAGNTFKKGQHNCLTSINDKSSTDHGAFDLRSAREGDWVRIVSVKGGRGFHDRFAGIGLRIGAEVRVLQNSLNGKLLLGHEGTRLFLGGGMAHKIQVVVYKRRRLMQSKLREMQVGETGKVSGYAKGASAYREKLLAMGLTLGTEIKVERIAPMGDPMEIQVRGFALSLRKDEASALLVERGNES